MCYEKSPAYLISNAAHDYRGWMEFIDSISEAIVNKVCIMSGPRRFSLHAVRCSHFIGRRSCSCSSDGRVEVVAHMRGMWR